GDAAGAVVAEDSGLGFEAEIVVEVDGVDQRGTGEQGACNEVAWGHVMCSVIVLVSVAAVCRWRPCGHSVSSKPAQYLWERASPRSIQRGGWHRLCRCSRLKPLPQRLHRVFERAAYSHG